MIDLAPPPLVLPSHFEGKRPAIIRPEVDPLRYFPVRLNRAERRAIHADLLKVGRVEAMLPGMVPIIVSALAGFELPLNSLGNNTSANAIGLYDAPLPGGSTVAGELLVVVFTGCNSNARTISVGAGWSTLYDEIGGGNLRRAAVFYKVADGSETSCPITPSGALSTATVAYRIAGASGNVESARTGSSGTSASFSACTPSWGTKATLWLAPIHTQGQSTATVPTGFSGQVEGLGGSGTSLGKTFSHEMIDAVSSKTPSTSTLGASNNWRTAAIAIEPA